MYRDAFFECNFGHSRFWTELPRLCGQHNSELSRNLFENASLNVAFVSDRIDGAFDDLGTYCSGKAHKAVRSRFFDQGGRVMIRLKNISKRYLLGEVITNALNNVSLTIADGEFAAIMGTSGSGKSTLLNIIGCMDVPTSGEYHLDDRLVSELKSKELSEIRNKKISFVFQNFALMEKYTAYENIELPLINGRVPAKKRQTKVREAASRLGIEDQLRKLPKQMSGGQQQRVAIARALASGAEIILADEPTGALDKKTGAEVMEILKELNSEGKTIVIVTHDPIIAERADRIITISDGRII